MRGFMQGLGGKRGGMTVSFQKTHFKVAKPLKVLIGCETSGVVRRAFEALGHDVWSCDLLPADDGSNRHIICDVRDLLNEGWDLLAVMHPPWRLYCPPIRHGASSAGGA